MATARPQDSDGLDWYHMPIEDVFNKLQCSREGLTSEAVFERLGRYGLNNVPQPQWTFVKFIRMMRNPRMIATVLVALNGWGVHESRLPSALVVLILLWLYSASYFQRIKNEISVFLSNFTASRSCATEVKVKRDGRWRKENPSVLVPGDVISIKAGDAIPADVRLLDGDPLVIDIGRYVIRRDAYRATKQTGDAVYSDCICEQGNSEAVVVATGVRRSTATLVDGPRKVTYLDKVSKDIILFGISFTVVAIFNELFVMYRIHHGALYREIDNLLVLFIVGGIPVFSHCDVILTTLKAFRVLGKEGIILKGILGLKEVADMDVLCIDTVETLMLNKFTSDKKLIEVFSTDVNVDDSLLKAAQSYAIENLDVEDPGVLAGLEEAKADHQEMSSSSSSDPDPDEKLKVLTYTDSQGKERRFCIGAPQKILHLALNKNDIEKRVHEVNDKFTQRGWHSVAVAHQTDNPEGAWKFVAMFPLFKLPRDDSVNMIREAFNLGIKVKIMTGSQLPIAKELCRQLGMGNNIYPVFSLIGQTRETPIPGSSPDDLIEQADGFSDVTSESKHEIVKLLQAKGYVCGFASSNATDFLALKKADIGIAVANAADAARGVSDIVLQKPGLGGIIEAVNTCQLITGLIKLHLIHIISSTVHTLLTFLLLALIWEFDFPPMMALIITIFNDVIRGSYAKLEKVPNLRPKPDRWTRVEIFMMGIFQGCYMASMTVLFFWTETKTDIFEWKMGVEPKLEVDTEIGRRKLASAVFLQVCISSLVVAVINRLSVPGDRLCNLLIELSILPLVVMISSFIAIYVNGGIWIAIEGTGWLWALFIWNYDLILLIPVAALIPVIFWLRQRLIKTSKRRTAASST